MKIFRLTVGLALTIAAGIAAGEDKYSDAFSARFKDSIDAAMAISDLSLRERQLDMALDQGTDKEVFFVIPLLFSPELINWADRLGICQVELKDVSSIIGAYTSSTEAQQVSFPTDRATEIRADIGKLIHCFSQYNSDGSLRTPAAQSNNSFKPNPLRGGSCVLALR